MLNTYYFTEGSVGKKGSRNSTTCFTLIIICALIKAEYLFVFVMSFVIIHIHGNTFMRSIYVEYSVGREYLAFTE